MADSEPTTGLPLPRRLYCKGMSRPFMSSSNPNNGQYNDELDRIAHQKMTSKPSEKGYNRMVHWTSTLDVDNLPASISDEFLDDTYRIITTVDVSMVRNAAANSLVALTLRQTDLDIPITQENCIKLLDCTAQEYAWGKLGSKALVARMKQAQNQQFVIQEHIPYAELWIGTHPNGMSDIIIENSTTTSTTSSKINEGNDKETIPTTTTTFSRIPLINYVQTNPTLHLGVEGVYNPSNLYDLTFLFKVLSIEKVLSIQAHPDKSLAAQLFVDMPEIYKDPNHKPEMAVALTDDFEALSGFRPMDQIAKNLRHYPEFAQLLGVEICDHVYEAAKAHLPHHPPKMVLRRLFRTYMEMSSDLVQVHLTSMLSRLSALLEEEVKEQVNELDLLILKLAQEFPGDAGIFAPLLFNHLKLTQGQAFFIGPNEPHAYIQGEILECMACSDNVVRAGLTPKKKDVETLVKMLTYDSTHPEITSGELIDEYTRLYVPPVADFAIEIFTIPPGKSHVIKNVRSPSVLLTLDGSGCIQQGSIHELSLSFGLAAFMSANTSATVIAHSHNSCDLKIARALSNVHLK